MQLSNDLQGLARRMPEEIRLEVFQQAWWRSDNHDDSWRQHAIWHQCDNLVATMIATMLDASLELLAGHLHACCAKPVLPHAFADA